MFLLVIVVCAFVLAVSYVMVSFPSISGHAADAAVLPIMDDDRRAPDVDFPTRTPTTRDGWHFCHEVESFVRPDRYFPGLDCNKCVVGHGCTEIYCRPDMLKTVAEYHVRFCENRDEGWFVRDEFMQSKFTT